MTSRSRTHTYPGEVGPWPAFELAEPILHASRITGDYAANRDATCDDGSDHHPHTRRQQRALRERTAKYNGAHIPDTSHGAGEAEVVDGYALAHVLDRFCREWITDRPGGYPFNADKPRFYGPMMYIHDRTGIPLRRLTGIRNGDHEHVNMSRADAILQAIGDGTRLDGELEPYPNPRWSVERWRAYMEERGCV